MRKLFAALLFLLLTVFPVFGQTYHYCPIELGCTWTGKQTFNGGIDLSGTTGTLPLPSGGLLFHDGTTQTTAGGGGGSGLFSSFQINSNTPITTTGNYLQILPGVNSAFQYSGTGSIADPYLWTLNTLNTPSGANGLLSGGYIFWQSNYTYTVTKATYIIGGVTYTSPQTDITLAAADPTFDRIDTVYANNAGTIGVITGTPASSPATPTVEGTSQVFIGYITVSAGTTAPVGATNTDVYLENAGPPTEWTCAAGTSWTCADTVKPFAGTFDIASDGSSTSGELTLTVSPSVDLSVDNIIAFQLATDSNWTKQNDLWVTFYNGANVVGNSIVVNNNFGWDGKASSYELVAMPLSIFSLSSNTVTSVHFKWNKGGTATSNITIHIDNVKIQQTQVGGQGTTSAITGIQMPGVVYKPTVPVVNNVAQPQLANFNTGEVVAGPIGALGTNVGVRQYVHCTFNTPINADVNKSFSCPAFTSPLIVGDLLLVMAPGLNNDSTAGFTDTQGNTFTIKATGGSNPHLAGFATATVSVNGNDTVSGTGIHWWGNGGSWSQYDFWVYELTGASAINLAYVNEAAGTPTSLTQAISPGASTDALIRLALTSSNNVGSPDTGTLTFSPVGSDLTTFTAADVNMGFGKSDFYAPGSTASVNNIANFTCTSCTSSGFSILIADITQSVSAGSAPPVRRRLVESDLPASAISAIQSVQTFFMASSPINLPSATNTTVITGTITMPSDGCPCRVLVQGGIFWTASPSGSTADGWWFSDGTNTFGWQVRVPTDSASDAAVSAAMSPVAYSNNQSVTFNFVFNPGTYAGTTIQAVDNISPPLPAGAHSWMSLTVMQSRN